MMSLLDTDLYQSLSVENQKRCIEMFECVFRDKDLRNRNVLHPGPLDSCVIGNLLNFVKHIFKFPFGCHGTDGNEALSLCLFSYRQAWAEKNHSFPPTKKASILYVTSKSDTTEQQEEIGLIAGRVCMDVQSSPSPSAAFKGDISSTAVVITRLEHPDLQEICKQCSRHGLPLHIHVRDEEFCTLFSSNQAPVHFDLPDAVQSLTIEEGMLQSGYMVYRDMSLRDRHLDVSYSWQTAYMSPNEGGSGPSTSLFSDFCVIMLGWAALQEIAVGRHAARKQGTDSQKENRLYASKVSGENPQSGVPSLQPQPYDSVLAWAKKVRAERNQLYMLRESMEAELVSFEREFVGGRSRDLETIATGGGTRSINLAFESVIHKWKSDTRVGKSERVKVLTGNPHLAVERAERRFLFDLERLVDDGALSVPLLKTHVKDLSVLAVYTQTLSYTDGITDPLEEIVQVIEEENQRRQEMGVALVTLINDCCLAFSVLVHNTNKRVLDLTEGCITPVLLTLDAHKHLGTDKGMSSVIGTPGTLSHLDGTIKVGYQPSIPTLVRAIASMRLIGCDGYMEKYHTMGTVISQTVEHIEKAGMSVIHHQNRVAGSTVFSVEDPSGVMIKKLKKRGHAVATLFSVCPAHPERCQTGWQLSLTPHALRTVGKDGKMAVEVFREDAIASFRETKTNTVLQFLLGFFGENSFLPCLAGGNIDPAVLPFLQEAGVGRNQMQTIVRRFFTIQLDCGTIRSNRRKNPLGETIFRLKRFLAFFVSICMLLWWRRRAN
jgi:hypothetical protein